MTWIVEQPYVVPKIVLTVSALIIGWALRFLSRRVGHRWNLGMEAVYALAVLSVTPLAWYESALTWWLAALAFAVCAVLSVVRFPRMAMDRLVLADDIRRVSAQVRTPEAPSTRLDAAIRRIEAYLGTGGNDA